MASILLINDTARHENWGAQASAAALRSLFAEAMPGVEQRWLSWDWLHARPVRIGPGRSGALVDTARLRRGRTLVAGLGRTIDPFPAVADDFGFWTEEWRAGRGQPFAGEFLRLAEDAGAVVFNGENALYVNTMEGCRALFLLWVARTVLGKPTFAINQTVHLTSVWPVMNAMVQLVYPRLDGLTVREPRSLRNLEDLGVAGARFVPDAVFSLTPDAGAQVRADGWLAGRGLAPGRFLCASLSGLPTSRPRGEWPGEVTGLVRAMTALGLPLVLLAKDRHCRFLEGIAAATGAAFFGPDHGFQEVLGVLRRAAALVTGHFHVAVLAALAGCPFVPLSANNHKMLGLCEALGWPLQSPHNVTWLAAARDRIVAELQGLLADRDRLARKLLDTSAEFARRARDNAGMVLDAAEVLR